MIKNIWRIMRTNRIGVVFLGVLVFSVLYVCRYLDRGQTELKPVLAAPAFLTAVLSTVGLISLFLGLLYQRRFQRADELIREIALMREVWHPDYRDLNGLERGYTQPGGTSLDLRYRDKHQRTVDTVRRFREYRQLFLGVPPYAAALALAFSLTVFVALVFWLFSLSATGWASIVGQVGALAVTAESLGQVVQTLWRVSWFPHKGTDLTLEARLGLPSWYRLLDARYLAERFLPFAPLVAALECYLLLSPRTGAGGGSVWELSFQLPLPLREWEWSCEVRKGEKPLVEASGWNRVRLTSEEADRFFARPGLWLQTTVATWSADAVGPDDFDDVVVTLNLRGADDNQVLCLASPAKTKQGLAWYGPERTEGPMRYPWFRIEFRGETLSHPAGSSSVLVLPPSAPPNRNGG